ncbi:hypothetical protein [Henriciella sp.]|uniref:hypothetical protein n=1 Tax=Henriciella sp. TaxID=1968823 RepID=UPI00260CE909|nr:hypothetical protein [Henriciella sp.]
MTFTPRNFVRLGLTAALLGSTSLAACGGEAGETGEGAEAEVAGEAGEASQVSAPSGEGGEGAYAGEAGEGGEGEGGEGGAHTMETLPIENRLAFMRGHVAAGLALYRAGAPEQAAKHLLHPVSETHAQEREGLDELGFNGELFVEISDELEAGTASDDIEDKLAQAEENLAMLADEAGGSDKDILNFLLDTTLEEYRVGVTDGEIVNAGEYADAFGFIKVASDYASGLEGEAGEAVREELEVLAAMWADAPLADSSPAPVDQVASQVSRVQLELSAIR